MPALTDAGGSGAGRLGFLLQYSLDLQVDGHLVADDEPVAIERDVEVDAELLAADLALRLETDAGAAPRVGTDAEELELQLERPGHVLDGELTGHDVVVAVGTQADRPEAHHRVLLDLEEVARAEVVVTLRRTGVHRVELDRG